MGLIAFNLGAVPVYSYGLLILGALLVFLLVAFVSVHLRHVPFAPVVDMLLWGLPLAVILGRAGYVLHHFDYYAEELPAMFALWQGGYSFYGSMLGLLIAVVGVTLVEGLPTWQWLDTLAPAAVLALAVVTFGVFALELSVGGALPQDVPNDHMIMEYVEAGYRPAGYEDTLYFEPIELYQAGLQLGAFVIVTLLAFVRGIIGRPRAQGCIFLLAVALVAFIRLGCGYHYLASGVMTPSSLPLGRLLAGGCGGLALVWLVVRLRAGAAGPADVSD